jgi:hypothetical protein
VIPPSAPNGDAYLGEGQKKEQIATKGTKVTKKKKKNLPLLGS